MKRRRFLSLTAVAIALPRGAHASVWQGTALGADVSITLTGPEAEAALHRTRQTLARMEGLFSLYTPSDLTQLNANGTLIPDPEFQTLCRIANDIVRQTAGRFDPTVQPLWTALAHGGDIDAARAMIGWDRVTLAPDRITLTPGQALTFNGIAQGFATDVVTAELAAAGFSHALVNIGEFRALGGPWRIGIDDPAFGQLAHTTLTGNATATSSPGAMTVGGQPHILSRDDTDPRWSTVSVTAPTAALADALSTAFCLMDHADIARCLSQYPGTQARLIDTDGNLITA
jgi:thiamine biosynthesis lipoprotein